MRGADDYLVKPISIDELAARLRAIGRKSAGWPTDRRRDVLLHELAHVKRLDCLTQALAQVACALYWFNPRHGSRARRMRVERERACDDLVLGAGTRASDYAGHLLEMAQACAARLLNHWRRWRWLGRRSSRGGCWRSSIPGGGGAGVWPLVGDSLGGPARCPSRCRPVRLEAEEGAPVRSRTVAKENVEEQRTGRTNDRHRACARSRRQASEEGGCRYRGTASQAVGLRRR